MKTNKGSKGLQSDNRGAIMVLGIFMACAMIGLTWEFIGLGDAMLWRDRSQEAADSAAFSSAAVQARAMNIIAFLNMVLLLMAVVYLAAAFIFNILDLVLVITGTTKSHWYLLGERECDFHMEEIDVLELVPGLDVIMAPIAAVATYFCTIASGVKPVHDGLKTFITKYRDNVMVPVMPKIGQLQKLIAIAGPYAGAVTASVMANKYEDWGKARLGTALSGTMVPASIIPNKNKWKHNGEEYSGKDERLGLPVETKSMDELCTVAGDALSGLVKDKIKIPIISSLVGFIIDFLFDGLKESYCKDNAEGMFPGLEDAIEAAFIWVGPGKDTSPYKFPNGFWTDKEKYPGPKYVVPYAENGNDWMQIWGGVYGGNREERAQKKVSVNGFNWDKQGLTQNGFAMYVAQAEMYFDCEEAWSEYECNGENGNLAMYRLNWRARMRRVNTLNWASDLFGYYTNTAFGDGFGEMVQNMVTDSGIFKSVMGAIKPLFGTWGEKYGDTVAEKGVEEGWKTIKEAGDGKVKGMLSFDTLIPTMIH